MLRSMNKDNTDTEYQIIGAQARSSNSDSASLVFCNYDDDTKLTYRLGEICVRDNYGNAESNGYGNMYFRTNGISTTSNNIQTQMCILHNGNVGIGTVNPNEKLTVNGILKAKILDYDIITNKEPFVQCELTLKRVDVIDTYHKVGSFFIDTRSSHTRIPKYLLIDSYLEPSNTSEINNEDFNYKVRIYDSTNVKTIGEQTLSNNVPVVNNVSLSNITLSNISILELQICKNNPGLYVNIENILLTYE